jgi:hypothetical protein
MNRGAMNIQRVRERRRRPRTARARDEGAACSWAGEKSAAIEEKRFRKP